MRRFGVRECSRELGSRDQGAVPLRQLLPSLLFCALGAMFIGVTLFLPQGIVGLFRRANKEEGS